MRAVRRGKIRRQRVGLSAEAANFLDDCLGFGTAGAVMNKDLGTSFGKRKCAGAANATRGAGDKGCFAGEGCCHEAMSFLINGGCSFR
jgi:hypothetical protein